MIICYGCLLTLLNVEAPNLLYFHQWISLNDDGDAGRSHSQRNRESYLPTVGSDNERASSNFSLNVQVTLSSVEQQPREGGYRSVDCERGGGFIRQSREGIFVRQPREGCLFDSHERVSLFEKNEKKEREFFVSSFGSQEREFWARFPPPLLFLFNRPL